MTFLDKQVKDRQLRRIQDKLGDVLLHVGRDISFTLRSIFSPLMR